MAGSRAVKLGTKRKADTSNRELKDNVRFNDQFSNEISPTQIQNHSKMLANLNKQKIQLTEEEKELLMLAGADSDGENDGEEVDSNDASLQARRRRDEKAMIKIGLIGETKDNDGTDGTDGGMGLRSRRNKQKNFHDDYVYDEKTMKETF